MEDESEEISEDKNQENKSTLSLNFIYKKIIIKEKTKNIKDNLSTLNYEKIAKYKMRNMSINFLLNSIFKFKNSLNKLNPLMKYIKNVKLYDYSINNINITIKNNFVINKNKNIFSLAKIKKEKKLDLSGKELNYKNQNYSRMIHIDKKKINTFTKRKNNFNTKMHSRFFTKEKIR